MKVRPRTQDENYVFSVFSLLLNYYDLELSSIQVNEFNVSDQEQGLKDFIHKISFQLGINVNVKLDGGGFGMFGNLPRSYSFEDNENGIDLFISYFGLACIEVGKVEVLLFLLSYKLSQNEKLIFPEEFYEDEVNSYRPFLVLFGVFCDLGDFFILRNTISASYFDVYDKVEYKYEYVTPLHLDTIIFASALRLFLSNSSTKQLRLNKNMLKSIRKEYENCFRYIKSIENSESITKLIKLVK